MAIMVSWFHLLGEGRGGEDAGSRKLPLPDLYYVKSKSIIET